MFVRGGVWKGMLCGAGAILASNAARADTPACTAIQNVAQASFSADGQLQSIPSNEASFRVAELLDLTLSTDTSAIALIPDATRDVAFTLTNAGNGPEAFLLDAALDVRGAEIEGLTVDRNGNGQFDPGQDLTLVPGAATPTLAPGAAITVFVRVRAGETPMDAILTLQTRAASGSGLAGSAVAGNGDGGCETVIGKTGAASSASVRLTVDAGSDVSGISVSKSQTVVAPNGSAIPVRGATVTYTIEPRFAGTGTARNARIADLVPEGTAYVPGSLRLDGDTLSDAEDDDSGSFDGTAIHVALGDVTGPATRNIQFQVKIK